MASASLLTNNMTVKLRLRPLLSAYYPYSAPRMDTWKAPRIKTCLEGIEKRMIEEKTRKKRNWEEEEVREWDGKPRDVWNE